ncbi:hypothetical protein [Alkaliflexus imshenetskii]|uniref:hypothetical protein n=1 Tax=Alkaliflexus imshenetskii TaxID=286730 RepID=UPI0004787B8F|nr:hypothetical protein [Alkaliflexus imshenetskii]
MTGACIIDTIDIASLGMFIIRGGDSDFVLYPSRREPQSNDWFEHHGQEIDFDGLTFRPKAIRIVYYLSAPDKTSFQNRLNTFETIHFAAGVRQIYVREFNKTFHLRFSSISDFKFSGGLYKSGKKSAYITADYVDDNPEALFHGTWAPSGSGHPSRVTINNIDMSAYGIIVQEIYNTGLAIRSPKRGLVQEFANVSGALSDTGFMPKKEGKQINMECTLIADSILAFWNNYAALFEVISVKAPLQIKLADDSVINCYYSTMLNIRKERSFARKIKLGFTLRFVEI